MDNELLLIIACLKNDHKNVVYCIKELKANPNFQKDGKSILMYAVYKKNFEIVRFLCENGADKELEDNVNNTVLMHAIYMCPPIAVYLINNGANINATNKYNETPVFVASIYGNLSLIKLLHQKGADINIYNHNKVSPLVTACGHRYFECVKFLVENGANINITSKHNDNLLHGCIENDTFEIFKFLLMNKNLKMINEKNNNNTSPLLYAIKKNRLEYAELLLQYGANPKSWDIMIYSNIILKGYLA